MDARPDVLAEHVRAKRAAIDNDLELLRVRLQQADPRRSPALRVLAAAPVLVGIAAAVWWARRRRART